MLRLLCFKIGLIILVKMFAACSGHKHHKRIVIKQNDFSLELPIGFDTLPIPDNNQFSKARIALGERLFFDSALSFDSTISCATCHLPDKYFTDGHAKSIGMSGQVIDRNSPSLFNVGYQPKLLREGGVSSIEMQALVPIQEHKEFNFNIVDLSKRLLKDSAYAKAAREAYGRPLDPFVITRALANYQRTLISGNSPFDAYMYQNKKKAISEEAKKGYALFIGDKMKCVQCHSGVNFTNYAVVSNGLYEIYNDPGKGRLTNATEDHGTFKVPSLRNVEMTAPYMHDGSMKSLDEIIDHYASGGKAHKNKSNLIKGFTISMEEREQLVAFLKSLTDRSVLNKP